MLLLIPCCRGCRTGIYDIVHEEDGNRVFYHEERSLILGSNHSLVHGRPGSTRTIVTGELGRTVRPLAVSTSGRYLAFSISEHPKTLLRVRNNISSKIISEMAFPIPYPMDLGWHPDGERLHYTDGDGIWLHNVRTGARKRIIGGKRYGRDWSSDGRHLLYSTGRGRYGGNTLSVFDLAGQRTKQLLAVDSGIFDSALFDDNTRRAYYALELKSDGSAEIGAIDLSTLERRVLWSKKSTQEGESASVRRIRLAAKGQGLLFQASASLSPGLEKHEEDGVFLLELEDLRTRRVVPYHWPMSWDYNRGADRLVYYDSKANRLREVERVSARP
jgi:hypothetical protein